MWFSKLCAAFPFGLHRNIGEEQWLYCQWVAWENWNYIYIMGKAFSCVHLNNKIVKVFLPLFLCPWLSVYWIVSKGVFSLLVVDSVESHLLWSYYWISGMIDLQPSEQWDFLTFPVNYQYIGCKKPVLISYVLRCWD